MRKKQGFSTLPLDSLNFDTKISRYITNHLDGRYGELHAIFLYGSYVNGFANETSDVDIICISKKNISPFHEKFEVFGLLFDAFVYDAESLNGAILISRASRIYPLIFSLSKSIIIPEASKVAKSLKDVATIVWARRQIGITFKLDINILSNLIDDLKHESNKLCLFTVCTKTYEHLIDMQLRSLGYGGFSGKTAARELTFNPPPN